MISREERQAFRCYRDQLLNVEIILLDALNRIKTCGYSATATIMQVELKALGIEVEQDALTTIRRLIKQANDFLSLRRKKQSLRLPQQERGCLRIVSQ